jgi:hypothetical protein
VHPDYRGRGVGSKLMDARFDMVRALNLRGIVAGSAIIDYYRVADHISAEQYVQEVIAGQRFDTNLSKQLHKGFQAVALCPGYLKDDPHTRGWGVTIVWHNPDYQPGLKLARVIAARQYDVPLKTPRVPAA